MDVKKGLVGVGIIAQDCEGFVLAGRSATHHLIVDLTMVGGMGGTPSSNF
jgi:hypothetical protein